jgi:hypothetical protein
LTWRGGVDGIGRPPQIGSNAPDVALELVSLEVKPLRVAMVRLQMAKPPGNVAKGLGMLHGHLASAVWRAPVL